MMEWRNRPRFVNGPHFGAVHNLKRNRPPKGSLFGKIDRTHATTPKNIRQLEVRDFGDALSRVVSQFVEFCRLERRFECRIGCCAIVRFERFERK